MPTKYCAGIHVKEDDLNESVGTRFAGDDIGCCSNAQLCGECGGLVMTVQIRSERGTYLIRGKCVKCGKVQPRRVDGETIPSGSGRSPKPFPSLALVSA